MMKRFSGNAVVVMRDANRWYSCFCSSERTVCSSIPLEHNIGIFMSDCTSNQSSELVSLTVVWYVLMIELLFYARGYLFKIVKQVAEKSKHNYQGGSHDM